MTQKQYDDIYRLLQKNCDKLDNAMQLLTELNYNVKNLNNKTIVINDVDKKIEQLKIDVESLKDEEEM